MNINTIVYEQNAILCYYSYGLLKRIIEVFLKNINIASVKADLTYLREMSAGNNELVLEMIDLFKVQINEFVEQMAELYKNEEWEKLGKMAHKAKSSVSIMGLTELAAELKWLELDSKSDLTIDKYKDILDRFNRETAVVIEELNDVEQNLDKYF